MRVVKSVSACYLEENSMQKNLPAIHVYFDSYIALFVSYVSLHAAGAVLSRFLPLKLILLPVTLGIVRQANVTECCSCNDELCMCGVGSRVSEVSYANARHNKITHVHIADAHT